MRLTARPPMVDTFFMPRPVKSLLILLLLTGAVGASQFVQIDGEIDVPIPDNWYLGTESLIFPVQIVYYNDSAEILLFRSRIEAEDAIANQADLKKSVDLVIQDVIESLPNGRLHTSTGFYDGYRTGFVLEFASSDSGSSTPLEHSLKGVLYRHPDGHQDLFTIWGKGTAEEFPEIKAAINLVQDGFAFRGEHEEEVFGEAKSFAYWPFVLVGMALVGLTLLRRRSRGTAENPPDRPSIQS